MKDLALKNEIRIKKIESLFCKKIGCRNIKPNVKKKQYKRVVYRSI